MMRWHIVTGEYPPQTGGVGDYTRNVARGLAGAGDEVHVWAPACSGAPAADDRVNVHRMPDHFGPRGLALMNRSLNRFPAPRRLLVQYVPHAYGYKAMNLPFCVWLFARRKDSIWIMFHEVRFPLAWRQPPVHNLLGLVNRFMALLVTRAAERIWVSIPAWERLVRPYTAAATPIEWLPIPSNIARIDDPAGIASVRARYAAQVLVGHFGTYGRSIADILMKLLPGLPDRCSVLLLGRGSDAFRDRLVASHPDLASRVHATGALEPGALSRHVSACDLMLQPYPDGASSRRTSLMVCLSHARPVVTTAGDFTEPLWEATHAVALAPSGDVAAILARIRELAQDGNEQARMAAGSKALYEKHFDLSHTIAALRAAA